MYIVFIAYPLRDTKACLSPIFPNNSTNNFELKIGKKSKFDRNQLKLSTQHKNMYTYRKKL